MIMGLIMLLRYLTKTLRIVAIASCITASGALQADLLDDAQHAYMTGDYRTARNLWELLADQGNARAQNNLGLMYVNGEGAQQDDKEALSWFRKAADQGYVGAQKNIGLMYLKGQGVQQDYKEAAVWYRKAAEQGDADAQHRLGFMYSLGQGVQKDDREAVAWLRKAAEQGNLQGQEMLGVMYLMGIGVPKNPVLAYMLKSLVATGDSSAIKELATLSSDLTKDQIEEAEALSRGWRVGKPIPTSTQTFNPSQAAQKVERPEPENSLNDAFEAYKRGDYSTAYRIALRLAEQGDPEAQLNLGDMYRNGRGTQQNYEEAAVWYRKAAEQGHADAQSNLGSMYSGGHGVPQNYKEAAVWYRKAAEQGEAIAQHNLAQLYRLGQGVPQSDKEAVSWYRKAAVQGDIDAHNDLGNMYLDGRGVPENVVLAYMHYSIAAFSGSNIGIKNLSGMSDRLTKAQLKEALALNAEWRVGKPLPTTTKTLKASQAAKKTAEPAKQQQSSPYPARPAAKPGYTTCNTRCFNGDCYRTYSNGKQVHFQAQRKYNGLSGQWEWDSGGC